MAKRTEKALLKKLNEQRTELRAQLVDLEQAGHSASAEDGIVDDELAEATSTFEREQNLSLADNVRDLLEKVDLALEKVAAGTYGECEDCGKKISAARLSALPHAVQCVSCKQRQEAHHH